MPRHREISGLVPEHRLDSRGAASCRCSRYAQGPVDGDAVPDDFAAQLERLLAPGDATEAGHAIAAATTLDDERLAEFLEALAARIAASAEPVTAVELRELLEGVVRSRRSASQDSSQ